MARCAGSFRTDEQDPTCDGIDQRERPIDVDPFGRSAAGYESWYATPLGTFVMAEEERALVDALPDGDGRLLDIGAGTGWWSRIVARRGFAVTALEPSDAMRCVGAGQGQEPIAWIAGRAERLPFADEAYDVVMLVTVLEFVSDPGRAMEEAWRVLRPTGTLLVGHLDVLSPWAALYRRLADGGALPWKEARFMASDDVTQWLDRPTDARISCVFLAPGADPPFEAANRAGRLAGNPGAFTVLRWRKPS